MKLIMVDLDGTLFDTKEVNYLAYKEAIEPYGYQIDYQYYCQNCNGRHYLDFLPQLTTRNADVLDVMHRRKKELYKKYLGYARLNQNLIEVLSHSKPDYKVAVVTTASRKNVDDILNRFRLSDFFDLIISQEDVIRKKPDPECFFKAMEYFQSEPVESIIFEDSEVGFLAAEKTGSTVFIVKGYN